MRAGREERGRNTLVWTRKPGIEVCGSRYFSGPFDSIIAMETIEEGKYPTTRIISRPTRRINVRDTRL